MLWLIPRLIQKRRFCERNIIKDSLRVTTANSTSKMLFTLRSSRGEEAGLGWAINSQKLCMVALFIWDITLLRDGLSLGVLFGFHVEGWLLGKEFYGRAF